MDDEFLRSRVAWYLKEMPPSDVGVTRGIRVAIRVSSESDGIALRAELKRMGYSQLMLKRIRL